jgi:hypothetical protein
MVREKVHRGGNPGSGLSSNSKCNTIGPDGLGCCDAKKTYRI